MADNGFVSHVHRKKPKCKPMPERTRIASGVKSQVRSRVEHVFAVIRHKRGLFIRTIGLARARTKIGIANIAYNMARLVTLQARPVAG